MFASAKFAITGLLLYFLGVKYWGLHILRTISRGVFIRLTGFVFGLWQRLHAESSRLTFDHMSGITPGVSNTTQPPELFHPIDQLSNPWMT